MINKNNYAEKNPSGIEDGINEDENGFVMILAVLIVLLLSIIGFSALKNTNSESKVVRNIMLDKEDFYITEGSIYDVAFLVDAGSTFPVTDVNKHTLLTPTIYSLAPPFSKEDGGYTDTQWTTMLENCTDDNWPKAQTITANPEEYAYRVYYNGLGANPKGYGPKYGTYLFDITARRQESNSVGIILSKTTIIRTGHKKIGPKSL